MTSVLYSAMKTNIQTDVNNDDDDTPINFDVSSRVCKRFFMSHI